MKSLRLIGAFLMLLGMQSVFAMEEGGQAEQWVNDQERLQQLATRARNILYRDIRTANEIAALPEVMTEIQTLSNRTGITIPDLNNLKVVTARLLQGFKGYLANAAARTKAKNSIMVIEEYINKPSAERTFQNLQAAKAALADVALAGSFGALSEAQAETYRRVMGAIKVDEQRIFPTAATREVTETGRKIRVKRPAAGAVGMVNPTPVIERVQAPAPTVTGTRERKKRPAVGAVGMVNPTPVIERVQAPAPTVTGTRERKKRPAVGTVGMVNPTPVIERVQAPVLAPTVAGTRERKIRVKRPAEGQLTRLSQALNPQLTGLSKVPMLPTQYQSVLASFGASENLKTQIVFWFGSGDLRSFFSGSQLNMNMVQRAYSAVSMQWDRDQISLDDLFSMISKVIYNNQQSQITLGQQGVLLGELYKLLKGGLSANIEPATLGPISSDISPEELAAMVPATYPQAGEHPIWGSQVPELEPLVGTSEHPIWGTATRTISPRPITTPLATREEASMQLKIQALQAFGDDLSNYFAFGQLDQTAVDNALALLRNLQKQAGKSNGELYNDIAEVIGRNDRSQISDAQKVQLINYLDKTFNMLEQFGQPLRSKLD